MKSAEEILKELQHDSTIHGHIQAYTFAKVIEAMEEYANQFKQAPAVTSETLKSLEELEEKVDEKIFQDYPAHTPNPNEAIPNYHRAEGFNDCWNFLKPHLSALLKEKDYSELENDFKIFRELYRKEKEKVESLQDQLKEKEELLESAVKHGTKVQTQLSVSEADTIGFWQWFAGKAADPTVIQELYALYLQQQNQTKEV